MQTITHYLARSLALFSLFGALLLAAPTASAAKFPKLNESRVVDDAKILTPAEETTLAKKIAKIETETGNQLAVATVASLQGMEIEDYGLMLGRRWKIGLAGVDNGLMIIVAPKNRKTRIEVGIGLEDRVTNAVAADIIQTAMVPRFKQGDFATGIGDAIDMIAARLTESPAAASTDTVPLLDGDMATVTPGPGQNASSPGGLSEGDIIAMTILSVCGLLFFGFLWALASVSGRGTNTNWNSASSSVYVHSSPTVYRSSSPASFTSSYSGGGSSHSSSSSSSDGGRFRGGGASGSW
jgi:uncharacterized protein